MPSSSNTRRASALAALLCTALLAAAPSSAAAAAPAIEASWVTAVTSTSADLRAKIDPEGSLASYRFEYETEAAYEANLAASREPFFGAARAPASGEATVGSGTAAVGVVQHVISLAPETAWRFRVRAAGSGVTVEGEARPFATRAAENLVRLPDERAWELVSPPDKDGGAIGAPGEIFGGGDFQAAAHAAAFTYSSPSAFADPPGAPPAGQYISRRSSGGWSTENVTEPLQSEGYGPQPDGAPYKLFSEDLSRALLEDPRRCEAGEEPCPRGYSLRESAGGALTPAPPEAAGMRVAGAAPDLSGVLFEDEAGEAFEWDGGATLAPAVAPPVAPESERISADHLHRLFVTAAEIPPFDNTDANSGEADTEVYLEGPPPGGGPSRLICVSCNPTGERPEGDSWIAGTQHNGSTRVYRPRVLSSSGNRVFFESADDLALGDTDSRADVYQWEAKGEGDCTASPGCQSLISGGRSYGGRFLDASADGADVYFLTEDSLVGADPGSIDVYDARAGGGLPEAEAPFDCKGDLCQPLPEAPEDPAPGTLLPGPGNPPLQIEKEKRTRRCPKGKRRRKGRCVARHKHRHRHRRKAGRR